MSKASKELLQEVHSMLAEYFLEELAEYDSTGNDTLLISYCYRA